MKEEDCKKTFVTDAAANMIAAFRLPNRAPLKRINCACHMLNTCLVNAVNRRENSKFRLTDVGLPVLKMIQDCRALVTHCKQRYLHRRLSVAPVQAVDTRWNSNVDMLESIIRLYPELEVILQERNEGLRLPSPVEFLQAVAGLLRPFKRVTLALSAASTPTLYLVVSHFMELQEHVKQLIANEYQDLPQYAALVAYQVKIHFPNSESMELTQIPSMIIEPTKKRGRR